MNLQEPFRISNIELNRIVYPKSRANQNKKIILIKYNEKGKLKNFVFQTPTLLNLFKPQPSNGYAEIEVALVGKEKSKVSKFIKFLNELEGKIKSDAQYHGSNWFDLDHDNQTINFQKIIRESEDYSNGIMKIKLIKNNDFETILQLNNNKRINYDQIPEESWCKMILECYAIWVNSNNDFGIFFRPVLVSFTPKEKDVYNYKFVEDSDDENDFDIPDTDVNNNIFMKMETNKESKNKNMESTSQLDISELMNKLNSESEKSSEIKLSILNTNIQKPNPEVLSIELNNIHMSSSDSDTESEDEFNLNKKSSSPDIDAETSETN